MLTTGIYPPPPPPLPLLGVVSHSSVLFPVKLYLDRVDKMADELARLRLADVPAGSSEPEKALEVVDRYLYEEKV